MTIWFGPIPSTFILIKFSHNHQINSEADISKEEGDGEPGPKTVLIQNDKGKYIPATVTERHRSIIVLDTLNEHLSCGYVHLSCAS